MNPTHCEIKFLNHEQFLKFVEKFGNEKNEIDFKYFGLKDEDLIEGNSTMVQRFLSIFRMMRFVL